FKYKSAAESFSRDKMSEADREQRQKITDDWYRLAKEDITSSGRISGAEFDTLVNTKIMLLASDALKYKLVDSLVRWDLLQEHFGNSKTMMTGSMDLYDNKKPEDNYWGKKPEVAVIYALGACAMESGINARSLVKDVSAAVANPLVKAIVLRVDSPGGDAMASDYISDVLRRAKGKKPIIVSQGFVAASGGYWLSMYSDTIVAAPSTITGSIGVIGGFFYDAGLKNTIGVSTDYVKKGENADAGFGFVIPLLGLPIMDKQFSVEQRGQIENMMKSLYGDFVNKVASGRSKKPEEIAEIAQGRVWSGYDGKKNGLVDVLGGLETAISIAAQKAHLQKGEYNIVQYPEAKLFDASMFVPKLISAPVVIEDPMLQNLKFRMQNNGKPLFMVPLDFDIQ
ncbi:MAG: S49 family peptidase, partial [Ignavibacteriales bacterium]|nr:S49 family peptidase [Ignavibacteriales bacterium]